MSSKVFDATVNVVAKRRHCVNLAPACSAGAGGVVEELGKQKRQKGGKETDLCLKYRLRVRNIRSPK
jgi:hypothetical protein